MSVKHGGGKKTASALNRGRSLGGRTRVAKNARRSQASRAWLQRQLNDPYVKAAQAAGYRSRAAYKLIELDMRFSLFSGVRRIVDLGAAPGGWCQVAREHCPRARIVGIDLLPIEPLHDIVFLEKDFLDDGVDQEMASLLGGPADLVLSDMASNSTGHKRTDHARVMLLLEKALEFARANLLPGGAFVAKVLAGGVDSALLAELKRSFGLVKHAKPPASRKDSSEWYVVARRFRAP